MARINIPQDPDIDWRSADNMRITPVAAVCHKTIGVYSGPDSGDAEYIEQHELAHIVVGEDEGEWEQLLDTEVFAAHCNGANYRAVGIEFSGLDAGGLLTPWQIKAWKVLIDELNRVHGIPKAYLDPYSRPPASVWVNQGEWIGWISHYNVKTDDGTPQHTDLVPIESWNLAMAGAPTDEPRIYHGSDMVIYENMDITDKDAKSADGHWNALIGNGVVKITAGDAYVNAISGVPCVRNMTTMNILAVCLQGANAQKNGEFWRAKV